mgnify:CR=1 FL=1
MLSTLPPSREAWVFPVPSLGARRPEVSDGWASTRTTTSKTTNTTIRRLHLGADIMFRRHQLGELADVYRPRTPNGTDRYFMPDGVPALAASAGVVIFARRTGVGGTVKIAHPEGWTTYYTHLSSLAVAEGQAVLAGAPVGTIGYDPQDPRKLIHLHFELWRGRNDRGGATNPQPYLDAWERRSVAWTWPAAAHRNAGLAYRPVGKTGERYPDWLHALKGKSGVYVIRERSASGKPTIVYVGQSNTGRLFETLTRHLQTWRRWKGFWKGQYAEGHDPGLTYNRARVEVAARVTSPDEAIEEEARLIARLRPRDNLIGQPEDVPF